MPQGVERIAEIYDNVHAMSENYDFTPGESIIAHELLSRPGVVLPSVYFDTLPGVSGAIQAQSNRTMLRNVQNKLNAIQTAGAIQKVALFKRGMMGFVFFREGDDPTISAEMIQSAHNQIDLLDEDRRRQYQKPKQIDVPFDDRWFNYGVCQEVGRQEEFLADGFTTQRQAQLAQFVVCSNCEVMDYCLEDAIETPEGMDGGKKITRGGVTPQQLATLMSISESLVDPTFREQTEAFRRENFTTALSVYRTQGV